MAVSTRNFANNSPVSYTLSNLIRHARTYGGSKTNKQLTHADLNPEGS